LCRTEVEVTRHRTGASVDVSIRSYLDPDTAVVLDPDATREALANLLDNARRHARDRIDVTVRRSGDVVEISVGDDGPGLPPGAEVRAFERFASLDGRGGSGLGLPIARAYIEGQGGRLVYDKGRFAIRLPARCESYPTATSSYRPTNV
jgi:signal transduction histidine kinase